MAVVVWSTSHVLIAVFLSVQAVLILPFLIFSVRRLLRVINCVYFKRRGRKVTLCWFASLCVYNLILFVYMFAYLIGSQEAFNGEVANLLHHAVGSLFIWINLSRCWQLFYNNKYYSALSSKKWRCYINPKETNWFINHRKTVGKHPYIVLACIVLWLVDVFVYSSLAFSEHCTLCVLWAEFPAYCSFYLLACLILYQSKISDIFYLKHELVAFIIVMIAGSVVSLILTLWATECYREPNKWYCTEPVNMGDGDYDDSLDFILAFIAPGFVGCLISCIVMYIGIHWVIRKNEERERIETDYNKRFATRSRPDNDQNGSEPSKQLMTLRDVLTDTRALEMFMQHLILEFCCENVLFLIETMAFKRMMMQQGFIEDLQSKSSKKATKGRFQNFLKKQNSIPSNNSSTTTSSTSAGLLHPSSSAPNSKADFLALGTPSRDGRLSPTMQIPILPAVRYLASHDGILSLGNDYSPQSSGSRTPSLINHASAPVRGSTANKRQNSRPDAFIEFPENVPTPAPLSGKGSISLDSALGDLYENSIDRSVSGNYQDANIDREHSRRHASKKRSKRIDPWFCAEHIVSKYVRNSSMLCINISGSKRKKLLQFVDGHGSLPCQHTVYINDRVAKELQRVESRRSWAPMENSDDGSDGLKVTQFDNESTGGFERLVLCARCANINCVLCGKCRNCKNHKESESELRHGLLDRVDGNETGQVGEECFDEQLMYELGHLFDTACNEIFMLLGDSFTRFQATQAYMILHDTRFSVASELTSKLSKWKISKRKVDDE